MRTIGALLATMGIISCVLYFLNYNLRLLSWMNEMPENQQWLIRGGLIVVGFFFLLLARKKA
jgi:hypothetical protein